MLNEAGGKVIVQDGVRLLGEDRVQSVRARLDRLCSGRDLDFKRVQREITVILCGREKQFHVFCECRAESFVSAGVQTGSVQCEVYPPDVGRYRLPEVKERFALGVIKPTEMFGGIIVQCVGRGIDGKRGSRRWHG